MYDLLLTGGSVVDGSGSPPRRADLWVHDGRIAGIAWPDEAPDRSQAAEVLDITGRYLMPGFIDAHVHADAVLVRTDVQEAMLRQGITTVVLGQDGLSFAPARRPTIDYVARYFAAVNGEAPPEFASGCTVEEFLAAYDRRTSLNVGYLVPLGTVRHEVMGPKQRPATTDELAAMVRLVEDGLAQGAVGVSTGLEYVPGVFADLAELKALSAPAARLSAPYVSHLRSYADGRAPGVAEARALGRETGGPVHLSHYRGRSEFLLAELERCAAEEVDVTFDSYPHLLGNTILAMKALPSRVQSGGVPATLRRLRDTGVRLDLLRRWFPSVQEELAEAKLTHVAAPGYRWAEGRTLGSAAEETGQDLGSLVCDLLLASDLAVGCIIGSPGGGTEEDVRALAKDHRHMACSDGIYLGGHPHPRGWGAFARYLGRHTRELGDWDWGRAARHLAGRPAERFQLAGRGLLAPGMVADLAVVDPETVADVADYSEPRRLAVGVSHVVVAGRPVLVDGVMTGTRSGRALRRGETGL